MGSRAGKNLLDNISPSVFDVIRLALDCREDQKLDTGAAQEPVLRTSSINVRKSREDQKLDTGEAQEPVMRTSSINVRKSLRHIQDKYTSLRILKSDTTELDNEIKGFTRCAACASDWRFNWFVLLVVTLNLVIISAVEAIWEYDEIAMISLTIERIALTFYIIELIIRIAGGQVRTRPWWVLMDLTLVLTGVLVLIVPAELCTISACSIAQNLLLTVRLLRLLKLVQLTKDKLSNNAIWILFDGVIHSIPAILATTCFIATVIAIFAGMLNAAVRKDPDLLADPALAELIETNFGTFPRSVLSLVQFISGDGLADLYFPLIIAKPVLALIFMPLILIVTIGLMSLVPVVLFEGGNKERNRKQLELRAQYKKITTHIVDMLGSKVSRRSQMAEVLQEPRFAEDLQKLRAEVNLADLWKVLSERLNPDDPKNSDLGVEEFLEYVLELTVFDMPVSAIETVALLRRLHTKMDQKVEKLDQKLQALQQSLDDRFESLFQKLDQHSVGTVKAAL